ncbi:MAG: phage portal protein [Anaerovoracaceae bacterium]
MFEAFWTADTVRTNQVITVAADKRLTDINFIRREIETFEVSGKRQMMQDGERYFKGDHDILHVERKAISVGGELRVVKNLPNNRIVDNQYKKMVSQKVNYLLGKPVIFQADCEAYESVLKEFFDKSFSRVIKNVGKDAINTGVGWLLVHYDQDGRFKFKRIPGSHLIPYWRDVEHTILDGAIRFYYMVSYAENIPKQILKVEVYDQNGVWYYSTEQGALEPEPLPYMPYFTLQKSGEKMSCNWTRIPLIPFKYNSEEIPLIKSVKSLQDGLNQIISTFQNNMEEDARNTIMVLVNYDGEGLGEFRQNLSTYGAIKVRSEGSGTGGDVKTLQVDVNAENYKAILKLFKEAIVENAMGYDAKDDRLSGSPNQMNIQSMYSDIDLDSNEMETEFQASFEHLLWFVNSHIENNGMGDFSGEKVEITFNRDILMNESEAIDNAVKLSGMISDKTLLAKIPWVTDPQKELERVAEQKKENMETFGFPQENQSGVDGKGGEPVDEE